MILLRTSSVDETKAAARQIADLLRGGDAIILTGDLGAGKTTFTQGLGQALGITDPITSPTFTLAREYEGRLRLHHLDVYRFSDSAEVMDVGLVELLDDPGAIVVVEWGNAVRASLPKELFEITLRLGDDDDERFIHIEFAGPNLRARSAAFSEALQQWAAEPKADN